MSNRCEQIGIYSGMTLIGGTVGALSGYLASYTLSRPFEIGALFGAVAGASFSLFTKGALELMEGTPKLLPYSLSLLGSAAMGYAAHELTQKEAEAEPSFYKVAALTYGIGFGVLISMNLLYCGAKQCCFSKESSARSPNEQYSMLGDHHF